MNQNDTQKMEEAAKVALAQATENGQREAYLAEVDDLAFLFYQTALLGRLGGLDPEEVLEGVVARVQSFNTGLSYSQAVLMVAVALYTYQNKEALGIA